MRVSQDVFERNSEDDLASEVHSLSDAGAGIIHLRTTEIQRCIDALRLAITVDSAQYNEWDIVNGWRQFDIQNRTDPDVAGDKKLNFANEILAPDLARKENRQGGSNQMRYFVYVCPQYWQANNPILAHMVRHYARELPATDIRVILVTPDIALDENLADSVVTVRFNPPGHGELRRYLDGILDSLGDGSTFTDAEKDAICHAGAGMGQESFEMWASIAIVDANNARSEGQELVVTAEDIQAGVNAGKTEIVNKNDLLELYPVEDMADVGGLDNLKEWIDKRKECYTEEAQDFGIESPKGIVCVGPPGTGKSLVAKAIAGVLNVPLIRLDFGKVFNSLVGSSEERIRTALRMVSHMAPCVLFVDEIDKGLGGIGGSGDSGTSSRVLGTFLTWLQDSTAPVFTMVTANNINGLPPELMRKGRFDEIFAVSLPDDADKRIILDIHLRKRGWKIDDFPVATVNTIVQKATMGFSGAEIEAAVKEGLIDGYSAGCTRDTFTLDHIREAAVNTTPLSKAYSIEIEAMTVWAKAHARAASKTRRKGPTNVSDLGTARKRIRTRVKPTDPKKGK